MAEDSSQTLSAKFDEIFKEYNSLENTSLPTNDDGLQKRISELISKLEETTINVSRIDLFSSNETIEEIPTSSIKFLLLPFLLGSLTLKKCNSSREGDLQIALVYFRDFIQRCRLYSITELPLPPIEKEENVDDKKENPLTTRLTPKDLGDMSKQREQKIKRFKEKKLLQEKVKMLNHSIENSSHFDDETLRDYYLTMLQQFCHVSLDELDSSMSEVKMLKQMKAFKNSKGYSQEPKAETRPLRPFLLTRNDVQKNVFGAGYPSLPSMTVEEFYEQRVKEGWFPPKNSHNSAAVRNSKTEEMENEEEETSDCEPEDDQEKLTSLRNRDEWRDMHRRGWGNTYNRS